jgi:hypothetical protein
VLISKIIFLKIKKYYLNKFSNKNYSKKQSNCNHGSYNIFHMEAKRSGGWHLRMCRSIKAHDIRFIVCWSLARRYYSPLWPILSNLLFLWGSLSFYPPLFHSYYYMLQFIISFLFYCIVASHI